MRIDFNRPPFVGKELDYIREAAQVNRMLCGDGPFTKLCSQWMKDHFVTRQVLLTTSCTHALEMAAYLADIQPGDEVIMPSYTFVSTADAFVLRGARIVFVDIRPDTMNIDETKIEAAITEKTKAIVPVHYAGVACAMDEIMELADRYHLKVIEDAAQGVNAWYKGRALGTIGDFGCYSFHETKNYSMGEGGAILFQDDSYLEAAEILREKGTNPIRISIGQVDKYTWVDYGSSYLPSDMNAAYLWAQLGGSGKNQPKAAGNLEFLSPQAGGAGPAGGGGTTLCSRLRGAQCHMYYLKVKDLDTRTRLLAWLKERGILSVFHYVPLHSSAAGLRFGRFHGEDVYTTRESERIFRLPMYYSLTLDEAAAVVKALYEFDQY